MKKLLVLPALLVLAIGCASPSGYIGKRYGVTDEVQVVTDRGDLNGDDYVVIGTLRNNVGYFGGVQHTKEALARQAMDVGGDAVICEDLANPALSRRDIIEATVIRYTRKPKL